MKFAVRGSPQRAGVEGERALVTVSEFRASESTTKLLIPRGREIVTVTEGSLWSRAV